MLAVGNKYHKNGQVYTVKSISRDRCINSVPKILLVNSCNKEFEITEMELVTRYSGLLSSMTINNQSLITTAE